MWSLKHSTNELTHETETDSRLQNSLAVAQRERAGDG